MSRDQKLAVSSSSSPRTLATEDLAFGISFQTPFPNYNSDLLRQRQATHRARVHFDGM